MNCLECKERMYPQDPSVSTYVGFNTRFKGVSPYSGCLPSLCYGCANYPGLWGQTPITEKEKESNIKKEKEKEYVILNKEQRGQLQQIHGEVFYLRNKLEQHLTKSKKKVYTIE